MNHNNYDVLFNTTKTQKSSSMNVMSSQCKMEEVKVLVKNSDIIDKVCFPKYMHSKSK